MSPLWPERLAIGLAPDRISLIRSRGWRRHITAKAIFTVPHAALMQAGHVWEPALETLAQVLRTEVRWHHTAAQVVLANSFVRYQLLAAAAGLSSTAEEAAYVQASFAQIHGEAAADWVYALAEGYRSGAWVGSAIDRALLFRLEHLLNDAHCRLTSLAPHIGPAFNDARRTIRTRDLWFVQLEPSKLLVGLIVGGRWQALVSRAVSPENWMKELSVLLNREWRLQGLTQAPRKVYISAPEVAPQSLNGSGKWEVEWLRVRPRTGYTSPADAPYALALGL